MARNRAMVVAARQLLCQTLGVLAPCPPNMIGSMAAIPLLDSRTDPQTMGIPLLQDLLFEQFGIEVPITFWGEKPFTQLLRISAQLYNTQEQYEYLAQALQISRVGAKSI